jgi:hypothetical protein
MRLKLGVFDYRWWTSSRFGQSKVWWLIIPARDFHQYLLLFFEDLLFFCQPSQLFSLKIKKIIEI